MSRPGIFHVKKRTLLAVACIVWLIAGINVARLGLMACGHIAYGPVHALLSLLVFAAFGAMFSALYALKSPILELSPVSESLEDVFIRLTGQEEGAPHAGCLSV